MNARNGSPSKPPFWHRSRLGWVNALGFALTLFLGAWLLLAVVNNLLPGADPVRFEIGTAFLLVLALTQVATVALGAIIVFVFMWRGADFHGHTPRLYVFFWTLAGLLFYLCQTIVLLRFGMADLPNAASWAEHIYWGTAPIGLAAFGLMTYVNVQIPGAEHEDHPDDLDDWEVVEEVPDYDEAVES